MFNAALPLTRPLHVTLAGGAVMGGSWKAFCYMACVHRCAMFRSLLEFR